MSAFTRTHRRAYSTASEPATSHPVGPWFAPLRSDDRRIADIAPLLVLVLFRRRQELSTPALHSAYTASMSLTRILRKLLTRSGSRGVSRMTVGLSSVGPPPELMTLQLLE